jgi:hypothetical protein
MTAAAVARSALAVSLARYRRSWGVWALLLIAPVGARFWVPRDDGSTVMITIEGVMPALSSPMIGVSLGIVVSTLLLPAAYVYLRANTTRRQPWQIADVTAASRVAIALGRFGADVTLLFAMLAALSAAGLFLGWLMLPPGTVRPLATLFALWAIAAPALMGLAALRILWDALPPLRGPLGDVAFFVVWMVALASPIAAGGGTAGYRENMRDFGGFVRPLIHGTGAADPDFAIGFTEGRPKTMPIDVEAGLTAPGYLAARASWMAIAIAVAALAGLVYRPRRARRRATIGARLYRLLAPGAPPAANPAAPPAPVLRRPIAGLIAGEALLIGAGRPFRLIAAAIAAAGLLLPFDAVHPAALLLLVFALTAHAGRAEAKGMRPLALTAALGPWQRRAAFVTAGTGWAAALTLPAALRAGDVTALGTATATGAVAATLAATLAAVSGSAFAPRLFLLILWYGYVSR